MQSSVKQRLREFINYKKIPTNRFEKLCGLSTGYVSNIRVSIQPDKIKSISHIFPELNMGWLLTGEGEMLKKLHNASGLVSDVRAEYEQGSPKPTKHDVNLTEIIRNNSQLVDNNTKLTEAILEVTRNNAVITESFKDITRTNAELARTNSELVKTNSNAVERLLAIVDQLNNITKELQEIKKGEGVGDISHAAQEAALG